MLVLLLLSDINGYCNMELIIEEIAIYGIVILTCLIRQ